MQTIEVTIEDPMLAQIDRLTRELALMRSDFIRQSLKAALEQQEEILQERRHAAGYTRYPVEPGEFDGIDTIRMWGKPYEPR